MEILLVFVITFVFFMAVWIIALLIGRSISKKKLSNFREYLQEKLPEIDPDNQEVLIARQVSRQIRPDIAIVINNADTEIIILQDIKKEGIHHYRYDYNELAEIKTSDQILSRGLFPKTYSYEETLHVSFKDGKHYQFVIENISNKKGNDQGADVVRNIIAPWHRKLNAILEG
jgi:sugar-specific transcriptional regulator TrmB